MEDRRESSEQREQDTPVVGRDRSEPVSFVQTLASIHRDYRNHGFSLTNPALYALAVYRLGRWSMSCRTPVHWLVSKLYGASSPVVRFTTGVTMDRSMRMGRDLRLLSGGVISMHPRATLGQRVLIMRNVTLGATPDGGVPTIEDDVVIGAGAVVIGNVTIGYGARIAANSLVISDVPANHAAMGVPARHRPLQSRPGPASPAATRTSPVGETGGPST